MKTPFQWLPDNLLLFILLLAADLKADLALARIYWLLLTSKVVVEAEFYRSEIDVKLRLVFFNL